MRNNSIYILTGEINSGKTTAIENWAFGRADVCGILSPKISGKRVFQDIKTGERFNMEAAINETDVLEISRYKFSEKAFDKASFILQQSLLNQKGWLIVDEVGPLELQGKGFYNIMNDILADTNNELQKLLVVREALVGNVTSFFKIEEPTMLRLPLKLR